MEFRKTLTEAIVIFSQNKMTFLRNFLPTVAFLIVVVAVMYFLSTSGKLSKDLPVFGYITLIFICVFAFLVILAKSIVHTHRTFILNEKASVNELFKLTERDFRFIKKFIALNVVMLLIGIVIMAIFWRYLIDLAQDYDSPTILFFITLATTLMTAFVWSRLAIVLPSAALDQNISIQSAWRISDDYSLKLFIGVGLLPVITDLVISYLPTYNSHIYTFFVAVTWIIVAVVEIGILSLIYKEIAENKIIAE